MHDFNPLDTNISFVIDQMPGYFLWKNLNSVYLAGSSSTALLFGYRHRNDLIEATDYEIPCPAAEFADLFVTQDQKVKSNLTPILVLDVHPYSNHEVKTLLINKVPFFDKQQHLVGISCHCVEVKNAIMNEFAIHLSKNDLNKLDHINKAVNYYLNSDYPDIDLSQRETECLFYLLRGKTAKQIGRLLNLSPRTIEFHIERICAKIGCQYKPEIIDKALEKRFFEIIPASVVSNKLSRLFLKNND